MLRVRRLIAMEHDRIAEVGIDEAGRLYVATSLHGFPFMDREAIEVGWDARGGVLYSPTPREWRELGDFSEWTYPDCFRHIVSAVELQGRALHVSEATRWSNVPAEVREELCEWEALYRA